MIDIKTDLDSRAFRESTLWSLLLAILLIVVGVGLMGGFITLSILYNQFSLMIMLLFCVLFLASGLVILISIHRAHKAVKDSELSIETIFNEDGLILKTFKHKKFEEEKEVKFDELMGYKIRKYNLFLFLGKRQSWPVKKNEQLDQIIELLNKNNVIKL